MGERKKFIFHIFFGTFFRFFFVCFRGICIKKVRYASLESTNWHKKKAKIHLQKLKEHNENKLNSNLNEKKKKKNNKNAQKINFFIACCRHIFLSTRISLNTTYTDKRKTVKTIDISISIEKQTKKKNQKRFIE